MVFFITIFNIHTPQEERWKQEKKSHGKKQMDLIQS